MKQTEGQNNKDKNNAAKNSTTAATCSSCDRQHPQAADEAERRLLLRCNICSRTITPDEITSMRPRRGGESTRLLVWSGQSRTTVPTPTAKVSSSEGIFHGLPHRRDQAQNVMISIPLLHHDVRTKHTDELLEIIDEVLRLVSGEDGGEEDQD